MPTTIPTRTTSTVDLPHTRRRRMVTAALIAMTTAGIAVVSTVGAVEATAAAAPTASIEIIDAISLSIDKTAETNPIYKAADFDGMADGPVNPQAFNNALGATNKNASAYDDMTIVPDGRGGKAVRTVLRAGTTHSLPTPNDNGNNLFIALPGSYDQACMSYDIRFDSNFDWSLGGKLPGLEGVAPGTSVSAPTGGKQTDNGWSGRLMWLGPKAYKWAGPLNMGVSYMYHPGQSGTYGDNVRWNTAFVAGTWHRVKQCHTMNTVGRADGVLEAWIDGRQVVDLTDFVYRTRPDVHISHIVFSIFRGGNTLDWAGSRDNTIDIDNVVISRT